MTGISKSSKATKKVATKKGVKETFNSTTNLGNKPTIRRFY